MTTDALPIALYLRISDDQYDDERGVQRQEVDGRKIIDKLGREVRLYVDNDLSAYKRKVRRPEFERMLDDLTHGRIGGMVAVALDRLWRQPKDLERVIDIYETAAERLFFRVMEGDSIDLGVQQGRTMARIYVTMSNQSSADTARRVASWHRHRQQAGVPAGGPRPFGWEDDRITRNEEEAGEIRKAVERLMAGASNSDIVRDWNDRGVVTSKGSTWTAAHLRQVLRNPRLTGERWKRTAKNDGYLPVLDATGSVVQGMFDSILTRAEFDALQEFLDTRGRAHAGTHAGTRRGHVKYLLSGIVRCGECGAVLTGTKNVRVSCAYLYICPSAVSGGCGKIGRAGGAIDAFITATYFDLISERAVLAEGKDIAPVADLVPQVAFIEKRLAAVKDRWKSGRLDDESYFELRDDLTADRKRLYAAQAAEVSKASRRRVETDVEIRWEAMSMTERRNAIRAVIAAVTILPLPVVDGRKVRRTPLADQLKITWAT